MIIGKNNKEKIYFIKIKRKQEEKTFRLKQFHINQKKTALNKLLNLEEKI